MIAKVHEHHKSSIGGFDANIVASLMYGAAMIVSWISVLRYVAWLAPLALFFLEKESRFVKFHAMQAFAIQLMGGLFSFIVSVLIGSILGGLIASIISIISLVVFVLTVIAVYNAVQYKEYHIPVLGDIAVTLMNLLERK